ncbi:hypothetical protein F5X68DRAFT_246119 [Plectosphaerella plurivora]|uniref:GPI inositol-deacylase n=1 Tax=Plectosphaerella plurivora TaxID=936078 RepID=A0A9P8V5L8_9PEZI|nr:hypothetical protein F5X68DRAFT_246119 [Plectosphaerella plurivora]
MFPRKLFSRHRRSSDNTLRAETNDTQSTRRSSESKSFEASSSAPLRALSTSTTIAPAQTHSATTSPNRKDDPLGLSLLYSPREPQAADIIFIHGLGGSSRLTWCKNRDLELFWPQKWLPKDEVLQRARILSFGYNARYVSSTQSPFLGITDFSKSLLYAMLLGRDAEGNQLDLGRAPIIFVTHSMGGLVFKKAYLDAHLDARYANIVRSVKSVVFLSTPHHGSGLAPSLNRILALCFGPSSKQYVAELKDHSPFLQTVNQQFSPVATKLQIFSFYETLQTSIGLSSVLILDPESAKLGYPGEISEPLNADHHGVCKFDNMNDPSYKSVLGALQSLVSSHSASSPEPTTEEIERLQRFLSVSDAASQDLELFSSRRAEGTCRWLLKDSAVSSWISPLTSSEILTIRGRPGRGKSVIASFLIHHLQEAGASVQYFFFRTGDESKRSVGALLRTLASQLATQLPKFRQALQELADDGQKLKEADWRLTWKKLFANILFELESQKPLYWVIDGLDESHAPNHIFDLLGDVGNSKSPIKVLLTTRWSPSLLPAFNKAKSKIPTSVISVDKDVTDMALYVEDELKYSNWDTDVTDQVAQQILGQAEHNFLWVHLILQELKECNTEEDIKERIVELPPGMDSLYRQMEETITQIKRPSDRNLARQLLTWAIHPRRPIAAEELADVLEPEVGRLLDISQTTSRLCGHFISIESGRLGLIHQTAREYLTTTRSLPFPLDTSTGHAEILKQSMVSFLDKSLRSKLQRTSPKLFEYRAISWPYHLDATDLPGNGDEQLDLLASFFRQTSVLTWISILASLGQLKALIDASKALQSFVRKKRKADSATDPVYRKFDDLECLESWSRDLLKILGKFGSSLSQSPDFIYTGIAPFCPTTSSIHSIFSNQQSESIQVRGVSEGWNDCLARLSVGRESPISVKCGGRHLAVANRDGSVWVWDCATLHQTCILHHDESVSTLCFSARGDRLATYGHHTTKIWSPRSGRLIQSIKNQPGMQALCLQFVEDDGALLLGTDRRCVLRCDLGDDTTPYWKTVDEGLLSGGEALEGTYLNSPSAMSFSPDGSRVAIAFRRFPLTVWSLNPATPLKRISRTQKATQGAASKQVPFASKVSWHPGGDELIGIFMDGYSFKLNVVDGAYSEQAPTPGQMPSDIICSPDGLVYAICGVGGVLKLFDYETSTLIYQLNSEDTISALSFAPDGGRFFDIRGNYCSVWEPNVLIRLAGPDDKPPSRSAEEESSSSVQQSRVASEAFADDSVPVVLVNPAPSGAPPLACMGDEGGVVELFDYETLQRVPVGQTSSQMSVEHIAWSRDGERLCYAELGGRITVMQLEKGLDNRVHQARRIERFKVKMDDNEITQIMILPDSSSMFFSSPSSMEVWLMDPPRINHRAYSNEALSPAGKWVIHPRSTDHLLFMTPASVALYTLNGLTEVSSWCWQDPLNEQALAERSILQRTLSGAVDPTDVQETVESVLETFMRGHVLVKIACQTSSAKLPHRFFIFDTAAVDTQTGLSTRTSKRKEKRLGLLDIPLDVIQVVEMPLNVLSNGKLVFVDRSFWVCTWPVRSTRGAEDVQRHFFLPMDWVPLHDLSLLHVTSDGDVLCPHRGTLSVIQSSIGAAW